MKIDVYDTYATAPDGRLMHFDVHVQAQTNQTEVERLTHIYVGGNDPEIESERRLANLLTCDPSILLDLRRDGFSVQPLRRSEKRAA